MWIPVPLEAVFQVWSLAGWSTFLGIYIYIYIWIYAPVFVILETTNWLNDFKINIGVKTCLKWDESTQNATEQYPICLYKSYRLDVWTFQIWCIKEIYSFMIFNPLHHLAHSLMGMSQWQSIPFSICFFWFVHMTFLRQIPFLFVVSISPPSFMG